MVCIYENYDQRKHRLCCQILNVREVRGWPLPGLLQLLIKADNLLLLWPMKTCSLCIVVFQRQQEPPLKIACQRLLWLVMFPSWPSKQQTAQVTSVGTWVLIMEKAWFKVVYSGTTQAFQNHSR